MMHYRVARFHSFLTLLFLLTVSFTLFAQTVPTDDESIKSGEQLFKTNCYTCHRVKQKWTGPALAGYETRVPSIAWTIEWVKNSAKLIASGDEYANKIFKEYNNSQMTAFTNLKDDQILDILAYVEAEAKKVDAPAPGQDTAAQAGGGAAVPSAYLNLIIIGMFVILLLLLVILVLIVNALKKFLNQRDLSEEDKDVVESPYTAASIIRSPGFIFVVVFVVSAVVFKTVIDGLYSIGVQQGYAPKQPIAFSHKIHAGVNEVDCKYCHTGVLKGKQANIPSANICMNCHTYIQQGAISGTAEISKIYAAVGYDPATGRYSGKQKPIEWIRIHNLPDLAYFNHAQHVNVGNIECQTCHGPIQEMDVVKQYSLLTMGWCIDCHRKTNVNTKDNAYYDKLEQLHKAAKGQKAAMKVEDIGGLECAKCHY
jgi:mono/diheme cytochrome c family protein